MPGRKASAQSQQEQPQLSSPMPSLALAALTPHLSSHVTRSSKATVELEYFTWLFFFSTCTQSRDGLRSETSAEQQSPERDQGPAQPITISQASCGEAGSPVTRQRTKVPGERHQRSHLHTCKGPFCLFFFFPFEISNSSLWTKSCLSENIDLRPLTKLHFKQSRGLLFPLPTDVSAQSLDLPGSCQKFCTGAQRWYLHKADFALNVSSFLSGKNLGNNQVGALSPAIHLASHCR